MTVSQFKTRQVISNSTTNTTNAASTNGGGQRISSTVLAVMIPLIVILAAAIIGTASYFLVRMRRRRLRRTANQTEGPTDAGPFGIGPPMEEGLNELGEAPPPYVLGAVVKNNTGDEVVEEVFDEPTHPPPAYLMAPAITADNRDNAS